jgi:hypothetical protein
MRRFKYQEPTYDTLFWMENLLRSGYQELKPKEFTLFAGETELAYCHIYEDINIITFNFYFPGMLFNEDFELNSRKGFYFFMSMVAALEERYEN